MSLPNKDELKKQQAAASANAATAAAAAAHKAQVDSLTNEIETAVLAGNWNPTTRGYLQPVMDEVIANFAAKGYTVVLVSSSRNGRTFKVS
jgi:phosphoserine phosphatase